MLVKAKSAEREGPAGGGLAGTKRPMNVAGFGSSLKKPVPNDGLRPSSFPPKVDSAHPPGAHRRPTDDGRPASLPKADGLHPGANRAANAGEGAPTDATVCPPYRCLT